MRIVAAWTSFEAEVRGETISQKRVRPVSSWAAVRDSAFGRGVEGA